MLLLGPIATLCIVVVDPIATAIPPKEVSSAS